MLTKSQLTKFRKLKPLFDFPLYMIVLSIVVLNREKTEHNVIKFVFMQYFDWLLKFPEIEITKFACT